MKVLKVLSGGVLLYFILFTSGTQFSACVKKTIYDTVIVKDTTIIRDTTIVRDTVDCNCYDLKDGLVAWYNFKGGNLKDSSGNNNHIVFNNATQTADRFGKPNGAYLFNGNSNYMRVANSASINPTQAITLAAWVKINAFTSGACNGTQILGKVGATDLTDGIYYLRVSDHNCGGPIDVTKQKFSGVYGDMNMGIAAVAGTDTVFAKTAQWYSIVYTYENGQSKMYINGELKDSRQIPATFTPQNTELNIGRIDDAQYPYWFNGVIDEIRIYNKALCLGEVKQLQRLTE